MLTWRAAPSSNSSSCRQSGQGGPNRNAAAGADAPGLGLAAALAAAAGSVLGSGKGPAGGGEVSVTGELLDSYLEWRAWRFPLVVPVAGHEQVVALQVMGHSGEFHVPGGAGGSGAVAAAAVAAYCLQAGTLGGMCCK